VIADGGWIAGNGQNVAYAANGPSSEKSSLQTNNILVAGGEMRNGFDAASFESAGDDKRVHADAGHGAGVDVNGIDFAGSHDFSTCS